MNRSPRALTSDEIRTVVRKHPTVFAAIGSVGANNVEEASGAVANLILANPSLIDAIVAAGMEIDEEAARRMPLLKWLLAVDILAQTTAGGMNVASILFEEVAPLCLDAGGSLQ